MSSEIVCDCGDVFEKNAFLAHAEACETFQQTRHVDTFKLACEQVEVLRGLA